MTRLSDRIKHGAARAFSALAVAAFLASGCGKESTDPAPTPDPTPEPEPEVPCYTIDVTEITTWSAKLAVSPQKSGLKYYSGIVSKHIADSLGSDSELIKYEIGIIKEAAKLYETDYQEFVKGYIREGSSTVSLNGFLSDTDYFAYAFTFSDDRLSGQDLEKTAFRTSKVTPADCSFTIDVSNVTKNTADIKVTPSNNGCEFFWDYVSASDYEKYGGDDGIIATNVDLIRRAVEIYQMAGYSKSFKDFLSAGPVAGTAKGLQGGREYVIVAFGLDPSGTGTTGVFKKTFTTIKPEQSSLTFKTEVFDLKFNGAKIAFTPSNDNETYFTDCMDYETFSQFKSGEEVIDWVLDQAGSSITSYLAQGYHEVDASDLLASKTKYVAYAFGYDGGPTTGLTTVEFTTPEMPTGSEVSVKVEYKIVDAGTLNPTYSGQTALVLTLTPSPAAEHWYAGVFQDDLSGYNDATIIEALQAKGYKDKKELALIVKEGQNYTIAAVAVDPGGTAGALTKLEVKIGSGTKSPASLSTSGGSMNMHDGVAEFGDALTMSDQNQGLVLDLDSKALKKDFFGLGIQ